ncbi:VanZ family protein [Streptomyces sp. AC563]|uniref:VanZ family protein n=1 Tax=Streptomyces buecherae TaxID=2763006 RepID=UPI00164D11AC|nr:VanZ family protein [Streptomyces buecherae]MBC3981571.1 VanZ family protein [Streptomyces buecherae]MBC3989892.1 VanZ family protein [Streptomyces buecherae]QNJ42074.1 VanZ family protein [Streptomyces buecherae]
MQGHGPGRTADIRFRFAGILLLVAQLAFIAWLSLRPLAATWVTASNLEPLASIRGDLDVGFAEATRRIARELLLYAPLGVLLPLAGGRVDAHRLASLLRTVLASALISCAIELAQSTVSGQVVDVDTVLLNTAGVALAHLAVVPAVRARLRRRGQGRAPAALPREEAASGMTPTISRVGIAP